MLQTAHKRSLRLDKRSSLPWNRYPTLRCSLSSPVAWDTAAAAGGVVVVVDDDVVVVLDLVVVMVVRNSWFMCWSSAFCFMTHCYSTLRLLHPYYHPYAPIFTYQSYNSFLLHLVATYCIITLRRLIVSLLQDVHIQQACSNFPVQGVSTILLARELAAGHFEKLGMIAGCGLWVNDDSIGI